MYFWLDNLFEPILWTVGERERERKRETDRLTERESETDRQTDRQTDRDRVRERETERQTNRQTDRQTDRDVSTCSINSLFFSAVTKKVKTWTVPPCEPVWPSGKAVCWQTGDVEVRFPFCTISLLVKSCGLRTLSCDLCPSQ